MTREEAIEKVCEAYDAVIEVLQQPEMSLLQSVKIIEDFLTSCDDHSTSTIMVAPDGTKMNADWGYFEDGLEVIKRYAEGRTDDKR